MSTALVPGRRIRRQQRAVLLLAILLTAAPATHHAAPEIIILHGGVLDTRVVITDKRETSAFNVMETASVSAEKLAGRPYFDAALFWGPVWASYARDSVKVRTLDPQQADQLGRVYLPERIAEAAVFVYHKGAPDIRQIRRLSPDGMRLLQRYGVPAAKTSRPERQPER
jgi:hypothetical protein